MQGKIRVFVLPTSGPVREEWIPEGDHVEELQELVGGTFDREPITDRVDLWVRDDVFPSDEVNLNASVLLQSPIIGNAVLAGHDGRGRTVSVPDGHPCEVMLGHEMTLRRVITRLCAALRMEDSIVRVLESPPEVRDKLLAKPIGAVFGKAPRPESAPKVAIREARLGSFPRYL